MSKPAAYRQSDLVRALKGAAKAGQRVATAEIDNTSGAIKLTFAAAVAAPMTALDEWKARRGSG